MRKLLLSTLLLFSSVNGTGICDPDQITIHFPSYLEGALVTLDEDRIFHVTHEGTSREVQNCFVDTLIRNCTHAYLITFFACGGYLIVDEFTDGELYIKAKMRLNGGGWFDRTSFLDWVHETFVMPDAVTDVWPKDVKIADLRIWQKKKNLKKGIYKHGKKNNDRKKKDHPLSKKEIDNFKMDNILAFCDDKKVKRVRCGKKLKDLIADVRKIDKPDFESGPCFPEKKPNAKCVVGPGIPIARFPIRIPGMNPPYQKAPREIVRQPIPIIIGPTFSA